MNSALSISCTPGNGPHQVDETPKTLLVVTLLSTWHGPDDVASSKKTRGPLEEKCIFEKIEWVLWSAVMQTIRLTRFFRFRLSEAHEVRSKEE